MLDVLEAHPHALAVLGPAVADGAQASHAYLFHGPGGTGKRTAARELAASLLAEGSRDPEHARARARSGAHPDLTWITPSGAHEILVADIAEPVIAAASRTPFESARRVFVIERADELGDEAANRMLKTLEEPPAYVHLILISERPADVLPTIRSRCQPVRFDPPAPEQVAAELGRELSIPSEVALACARLSLGDATLARELASPAGAALREAAEALAVAVLDGDTQQRPWQALLATVKARGEALRDELETRRNADAELVPSKERPRVRSEWDDRIKRAMRRRARLTLDLGLQLVSLWLADLAALAWTADDLVRNVDRLDTLREHGGRGAHLLLAAVDAVEETRGRFVLNVNEELACEALAYRLEQVLAS